MRRRSSPVISARSRRSDASASSKESKVRIFQSERDGGFMAKFGWGGTSPECSANAAFHLQIDEALELD